MMNHVYRHFLDGFENTIASWQGGLHRIGAEMKFPLVDLEGNAAPREAVNALWAYLQDRGWEPVVDGMTDSCVGAKRPGPFNDTVASCETGYCKTEFSFAHVADLHELEGAVRELREILRPFCEKYHVLFLGYGIQPVTPPSKKLLMKQRRTSVWDKIFPSNDHIPKEEGDDVHLFTINAASHVHVGLSMDEAIPAINVLNGFAGPQIALTANSNVWKGELNFAYKCVAEKFWDWWMRDSGRVGVPEKPFDNLEDYVETIATFKPVYVVRNGRPITLEDYATFSEYFSTGRAAGLDDQGRRISLVPEKNDIDLHNSCYWYNARLSRYYTVENRANDQQPRDELLNAAALTLGLVSALPEAGEELGRHSWRTLRAARETACLLGLSGRVDGIRLKDLAARMLSVAHVGLERRGRGEESFLEPLERRLRDDTCPADDVAEIMRKSGIPGLVQERHL